MLTWNLSRIMNSFGSVFQYQNHCLCIAIILGTRFSLASFNLSYDLYILEGNIVLAVITASEEIVVVSFANKN